MPKYLVIKKQEGDGCDYSIGCGVRLDTIEAESTAEAVEMLRECWTAVDRWDSCGELDESSEHPLAAAWIIPWTDVLSLPIVNWKRAFERNAAEMVNKAVEEDERAQLARLQEKYGS
jgi:hypothetical protein